jgi:hypothetical protein
MWHHTIADIERARREHAPENFRFVEPTEITVRTAVPKWTWVARVAHEIPAGKCILLPVPETMTIHKFMDNLRCNLSTASKVTVQDRFSVRRSKCGKYVVLMKVGTWNELYREMETRDGFSQ